MIRTCCINDRCSQWTCEDCRDAGFRGRMGNPSGPRSGLETSLLTVECTVTRSRRWTRKQSLVHHPMPRLTFKTSKKIICSRFKAKSQQGTFSMLFGTVSFACRTVLAGPTPSPSLLQLSGIAKVSLQFLTINDRKTCDFGSMSCLSFQKISKDFCIPAWADGPNAAHA